MSLEMCTQEKVYLDAQAACGLQVGDYVILRRPAIDHEAGWRNSWPVEADKYVGKVGFIDRFSTSGIAVKFLDIKGSIYFYPYFVLEKTEKPEPQNKNIYEFKEFQPVLVRNTPNSSWQGGFFAKKLENSPFPYMDINCNQWRYCIPHEGNEGLLFTTEAPEEKQP